MKIQLSDHQDKAYQLRQAILDAGHEVVESYADLLLIDFDGPIAYYPRVIEEAYAQGADVYLYSHGAMPLTCWDGVWKPHPYTRGYLAQTPGQKRVMEAYGYPNPIHVIGWHYCEQLPFRPTEARNVLFAPWHPQGTGFLLPEGQVANKAIFSNLVNIQGINLRVRLVGRAEQNNIEIVDHVEYEPSNRSLSGAVASILKADLVVGYGTIAYLAVALGIPTIMYGQNTEPYDGYSPETLKYVKNWHLYRDIMHYPFDADGLGIDELTELMSFAAQHEAAAWREEFIGQQWDKAKFVALLEQLAREKSNEDY